VSAEQIISEIEWIEHLFRLLDNRTPQTSGCPVENQQAVKANLNPAWPRLPRQEWLDHLFRLHDHRPLPAANWKAVRLYPPAVDPATP
jgi:hypothetical protein